MDALLTYFISVSAYCLAFALLLFAIVVFVRRKERLSTPSRGAAVFFIGWMGGSVAVFLVHLLFAVVGTQVANGPLEGPVAILTVLPIIYFAHARLSESRIRSE